MGKTKGLFDYSPREWALKEELEKRIMELRESGAESSKISEEYINQAYFDLDFVESLRDKVERKILDSESEISTAEIDSLIEVGFDLLRKHNQSVSSLDGAKRTIRYIFLEVIVPHFIQKLKREERSMLPKVRGPAREIAVTETPSAPKTMRRPGNRYSSRDLNSLVKIANRLDSLGLQKEADIIDTFINKIAVMSEGDDLDLDDLDIEEYYKSEYDGSEYVVKSWKEPLLTEDGLKELLAWFLHKAESLYDTVEVTDFYWDTSKVDYPRYIIKYRYTYKDREGEAENHIMQVDESYKGFYSISIPGEDGETYWFYTEF
jgi:hypothetical protein